MGMLRWSLASRQIRIVSGAHILRFWNFDHTPSLQFSFSSLSSKSHANITS
jgi:hypothetical protein